MFDNLERRTNTFLRKYPLTIAQRLRAHNKIIEKHLNVGEEIIYMFPAQKQQGGPFSTCIVCCTDKRIIIGQKKVFPGYHINSITPDLFNDFQVYKGWIWGKVTIDTAKEIVTFTYIDSKALVEIETALSEYFLTAKQKYLRAKKDD